MDKTIYTIVRKGHTIVCIGKDDNRYDLNYFTNSGGFIKDIKIVEGQKGRIMTITIDKSWYEDRDCNHDILAIMIRECNKYNVEFDISEVKYKLI